MAMSHLDASKDPTNAFDDFGNPLSNATSNPFNSVANSQFGIVPNMAVEVSQATPERDERAPAEWGTASTK